MILTGGDDIGVFPERDATEIRLLEWCEDRGAPVIGVCRGFQVMAHRLGAALLPVNPGIHRAKRHTVVFADGCEREVNSYHNMGVSIENRRDFPMAPLAWCGKDRSLEAAASAKDAAMMWHPEREPAPDPADVALFKKYLRID